MAYSIEIAHPCQVRRFRRFRVRPKSAGLGDERLEDGRLSVEDLVSEDFDMESDG